MRALLPFLLALCVYAAAGAVMRPGATGDEPHYLIVAGSIAHDGDVELTNDYASRERVGVAWNSFPLAPHGGRYGENGELRSVHGYGLPVLLAPAVALGGVYAARVLMILLAALLADQLFRLLRDLGGRLLWRSLAWVAVCFCLPLLVFSNQIYPEVPAALICVSILRIVVHAGPSNAALLGGALGAAFLPWLHVRFLPVALAATLALAYAAYRTPERTTVEAVARALFRSPGRALLVGVPPALSLVVMALAFQRWYGSLLPNASYGSFQGGDVGGGGWGFLYHYLLSDLFHAGDGWIPYAPVGWLGLAGLGLVVWRWRWAGAAALGSVALYAGLVASSGLLVGYQFPGRILLAAIVLVAVPIWLCLEYVPAARFAFVPLVAVSLVIAGAALLDYTRLYPVNGGRDDARVAVVRELQVAFPDPRAGSPAGGTVPGLPDWPLTFLWVGGTVLAGALFVHAARSRR